MLHLRTDDNELNCDRKFACGIGPELPDGDKYVDSHTQAAAHLAVHQEVAHCPGCFGEARPQLGTPFSELSGRPGTKGFSKFCEIARSWGYD